MNTTNTSCFVLGTCYTRAQIGATLGGSQQGFLPFKDGRVLCGCFDPSESMNPNAPEEILFGEAYPTPVIDESAEMVFEQGRRGEEIPVFLKRLSNQWEYIGDYLCIGITRDSRIIARKSAEHPQRGGFSGVLRFERVSETKESKSIESGNPMMFKAEGKSKNGSDRTLEIQSQPDGTVYLWIHSPDSNENGWEIYLDRDELLEKLFDAGVIHRRE